ncbi:MAG: KH domain-containing protein [Deltaproteobacteria bacterium]|nr:KH domain-containing protein [Deltaproteobacteria bacterium]
MRDLMAFIARNLVREPDQVSVVELDDDRDRIFQLRVAPSDRGRVIGKEGRTARALRTMLAVASGRTGRKAKLDIVDS